MQRLAAGDHLYWEDFSPGVYDLGEYRFTLEEIVEFAERFDPQPFHIDSGAAGRRTPAGGDET